MHFPSKTAPSLLAPPRRRAPPLRRAPAASILLCSAAFSAFGCGSRTGLLASDADAGPTSVTFNYTGGPQTFVVPGDVSSVTIVARGAAGGAGQCGGPGGDGATASASIPVTPGETLTVLVGGAGEKGICTCGCQGSSTAGYNGGGVGGGSAGAGGGASDVRQGGSASNNRIVIAAGGGGGDGGEGGAGGGSVGASGSPAPTDDAPEGGGGGTQTAGGIGATSESPGFAGEIATGGRGYAGGGGGGGGGYYGGGGGGCSNGCGGGGGGSSYAEPSATDVSVVAGNWSGDGQVVIAW